MRLERWDLPLPCTCGVVHARHLREKRDPRSRPVGPHLLGGLRVRRRRTMAPCSTLASEVAALDEDAFQARARALEVAAGIPSVFDCSESTALLYSQGSMDLVKEDLHRVLPAELAREAEDACARHGLIAAFTCRRELVNFKKILLNLFQESIINERDLKQLATFYFTDLLDESTRGAPATLSREQVLYTELAQMLMHFTGSKRAVHDARFQTKDICDFPRHPGMLPAIRRVPDGLFAFDAMAKALDFLRTWRRRMASWNRRFQHFVDAHPNFEPGDTPPAELAPATEGADYPPLPPGPPGSDDARLAEFAALCSQPRAFGQTKAADFPPVGVARFDAILEDLRGRGWGPALVNFVRAVLVARGGWKAIMMGAEVERYASALSALIPCLERLKVAVEALRPCSRSGPRSAYEERLHMFVDSHALGLEGFVAISKDICAALARILQASGMHEADEAVYPAPSSATLFVGADSDRACGTSMFYDPSTFHTPSLLMASRPLILERKAIMLEDLRTHGWPRAVTIRKSDRLCCARCGDHLASMWMHNGVCFTCEDHVRSQGMCPFCGATATGLPSAAAEGWSLVQGRKAGGPARRQRAIPRRASLPVLCPHANRCFICDWHSCGHCRLVRGDGEDVEALASGGSSSSHQGLPVGRLAAICLDFDRTLCSTRHGACPEFGKHKVDADLISVLFLRDGVRRVVVTRNQHQQIKPFLLAHGVPPGLELLHTPSGVAKAEILQAAGILPVDDGDVVVVVDDKISELVDSTLAEDPRVIRVLFARGFRATRKDGEERCRGNGASTSVGHPPAGAPATS